MTTRLSHTRLHAATAAEELAALIKLVNTTASKEDPSGEWKIAGWIAPPGASWADYTQRYGFTPILLQPAEAPGPPGWTRISPWPDAKTRNTIQFLKNCEESISRSRAQNPARTASADAASTTSDAPTDK